MKILIGVVVIVLSWLMAPALLAQSLKYNRVLAKATRPVYRFNKKTSFANGQTR